jgi:sugar phosphate isomerase/epimerase
MVRESRYGKVVNLAAEMRTLLESLKPDLELANEHGFRIAIENHSHALLNSLDSFKVFLEMSNHPRLGVAVAPHHLQIAGVAVEEVIALAGKRNFFFYAWQHEPELKQLPGVGPADFTPWLKALARVDYGWYVNPFMHGDQPVDVMAKALADSRRYMENCRQKI